MKTITFYDGTTHTFEKVGLKLRFALQLASHKLSFKGLARMRWYAVIQYFLIVLAVMHLVQYGLTLKAYGNGSSTLLACGVIICGLLAGYSLLKYSQISLASNKDAVITEMRSSGYTYSYKGPLIQKWMDTVKAQGRAYTLYDVTIMDAIADGPSKEMQCPS